MSAHFQPVVMHMHSRSPYFSVAARAKQEPDGLGSRHPLLPSAVWRPPLLDHDHALISVLADGRLGLMQSDIERVLFDGPAIHKRIDELAAQITADYSRPRTDGDRNSNLTQWPARNSGSSHSTHSTREVLGEPGHVQGLFETWRRDYPEGVPPAGATDRYAITRGLLLAARARMHKEDGETSSRSGASGRDAVRPKPSARAGRALRPISSSSRSLPAALPRTTSLGISGISG